MQLLKKLKRLKCSISANRIKTAFEILVAISTIVSMVLVFFTLREMQIARDRSYAPKLVIEDKDVSIAWSSSNETDSSSMANPYVSDDEMINPLSVRIKCYNIGVGVAQDIQLHFPVNNFENLFNYLETQFPNNDYKYEQFGNMVWYTIDGVGFGIPATPNFSKVYLLPNAEETFEFGLSFYLDIVREIYVKSGTGVLGIPNIQLIVSYKDIQGKLYEENILLGIENIIMGSDENGNGYATYRIFMN
jgi:hypothetical protein